MSLAAGPPFNPDVDKTLAVAYVSAFIFVFFVRVMSRHHQSRALSLLSHRSLSSHAAAIALWHLISLAQRSRTKSGKR